MALVGYTFIRNMFKYDYPLKEAVFSLLPAVDVYYICECHSDDGTYAEIMRWARKEPKIRLLRHRWGDHFTIQQEIANYILSQISPGDWCFKLDADEVIHEDSWELFQSLPRLCQDHDKVGARFHYTHFMGNYETEFDFMYRRVRRFVQHGHGWRWDGDACQLIIPGWDNASMDAQFLDVDVEIFHYGKVKEGRVGLQKEKDFQQLYTDLGFPDPRVKECEEALGELDYYYLFQSAIERGEVRKFTGTHPAIMRERIARFKAEGWEQFEMRMRKG